jgi:hypothetical protein
MNSKGTYIDPSVSSSSYPSSSFSNFLNPKNFHIPNQWNSTTPINTSSLYGMNMNGMNMNGMNMNGINMNGMNMNGMNMNGMNMNGMNMNGMNVNGMNNMNGMNATLNQHQNSGMNMNMNSGYGTLSQSIPQTFSSRNNNYNPSDYINDNFINKNYKTNVNDFSNINQQSTYEPTQSNYTNQNMTIKRNKKDFLDAKASIQTKIKKINLDNNENKNENENENEAYILRNTNYKKNVKIVDDKKQNIETNENNVKKLINEIINIIHS